MIFAIKCKSLSTVRCTFNPFHSFLTGLCSFVTKYSLNSHVKLVHQRRYQKVCHICAKVYSTSTSFRHHMKEHSDVKDPRVVCQICGRTYKTPKGLRNHMAAHNEENECFKCPQCPKISPNRHALSTHIRVMHNYKLHECHLCERKCKSAVALMVSQIIYLLSIRSVENNEIVLLHIQISNRSMWQRTPENTCTIAITVRSNSNRIQICISTLETRIQSNGVPTERQSHEKITDKLTTLNRTFHK